jgi:hypothetical protein
MGSRRDAGFILGTRQTVLETLDGGKTWEQRFLGNAVRAPAPPQCGAPRSQQPTACWANRAPCATLLTTRTQLVASAGRGRELPLPVHLLLG